MNMARRFGRVAASSRKLEEGVGVVDRDDASGFPWNTTPSSLLRGWIPFQRASLLGSHYSAFVLVHVKFFSSSTEQKVVWAYSNAIQWPRTNHALPLRHLAEVVISAALVKVPSCGTKAELQNVVGLGCRTPDVPIGNYTECCCLALKQNKKTTAPTSISE